MADRSTRREGPCVPVTLMALGGVLSPIVFETGRPRTGTCASGLIRQVVDGSQTQGSGGPNRPEQRPPGGQDGTIRDRSVRRCRYVQDRSLRPSQRRSPCLARCRRRTPPRVVRPQRPPRRPSNTTKKRSPRLAAQIGVEVLAALDASTMVLPAEETWGQVVGELLTDLDRIQTQRARLASQTEEAFLAHPLGKVLVTSLRVWSQDRSTNPRRHR
ncbi:MAG: hypothetical protein ACI8V4_002155 [Ilumatobacter sp.]